MSKTGRNSLVAQFSLVIVGLTAVLLAIPIPASTPKVMTLSQDNPYSTHLRPGFVSELFVYEFRWGGFPAATAEWRAQRQTVNGKTILEATGKAKTLNPVAVFWKMRGTVRASMGTDPIRPNQFTLYRKDNHRKRSITLDFDHESGILKINRIGKHGMPRTYTTEIKGQYDPVSAAFVFRGLDLTEGDIIRLHVQPGKNVYRVDFRVLGREPVAVKAGAFRAIVLAASIYNLTKHQPCTGLEKTRVWVSDDSHRLFLRAQTTVTMGVVSGELVAYQMKERPQKFQGRS
jgi:hypothetical protein